MARWVALPLSCNTSSTVLTSWTITSGSPPTTCASSLGYSSRLMLARYAQTVPHVIVQIQTLLDESKKNLQVQFNYSLSFFHPCFLSRCNQLSFHSLARIKKMKYCRKLIAGNGGMSCNNCTEWRHVVQEITRFLKAESPFMNRTPLRLQDVKH